MGHDIDWLAHRIPRPFNINIYLPQGVHRLYRRRTQMKRSILQFIAISLAACSSEFDASTSSAPMDIASEEWGTVFTCENNEAVVKQHATDHTRYQLTLKNNDINMYLGLGYLATPEGNGAPVTDDEAFVGFSAVVARFNYRNPMSPPSRIAHVFPDYGGLKVLVESEAHQYCEYNYNYGDNSGLTYTISAPLGHCPDLRPSYDLRNSRFGSNTKTSRD